MLQTLIYIRRILMRGLWNVYQNPNAGVLMDYLSSNGKFAFLP
jgi:hypothetical protein